MKNVDKLIDRQSFFIKYNIQSEKFDETNLQWSELEEIYLDYKKEIPTLESSAIYLFNNLMKNPHVHSVRYRIKDAEHVIEKIIRKRIEDSERLINLENYKIELTDLIGIRAIHLFKEEWSSIHKLITETWDLHEKPPVAYYREGDSKSYKEEFEKYDCKIKQHPYGYRSVHYIVETKPAKNIYLAEIQVRTIFEEAWSEIDHKIRYPYDQTNTLFGQFLLIFNRLSGSADEMGSYIQFLKSQLEIREKEFQTQINEKETLISDLETKIEKLDIKDQEVEELKRNLKKLKEQQVINLPFISAVPNISSSFINEYNNTADMFFLNSSNNLAGITISSSNNSGLMFPFDNGLSKINSLANSVLGENFHVGINSSTNCFSQVNKNPANTNVKFGENIHFSSKDSSAITNIQSPSPKELSKKQVKK